MAAHDAIDLGQPVPMFPAPGQPTERPVDLLQPDTFLVPQDTEPTFGMDYLLFDCSVNDAVNFSSDLDVWAAQM